MTKDDYLIGDMEMAKVDQSLVGGIGIEPGYAAYEATQYDSAGSLHIVYSDTARRAGIVYVGSGSSGYTSWTDASSVEDALRRYLDDEMSN